MDTVEFEKMLNSNLRDLLMVIYLSQGYIFSILLKDVRSGKDDGH